MTAGVHTPVAHVCPDGATEEYTLGGRVAPGAPLLADWFEGRAHLGPAGDAASGDAVAFAFTTPGVFNWDVKAPVFQVAGDPAHYAFVRGFDGARHAVYLMRSADGARTFRETGNLSALNTDPARYDSSYDPALAIDYNTCPPTYRMLTECTSTPRGAVDACESHTTTPLDLASWSAAKPLVTGTNHGHSASTPALLISGGRYALKWTDVQLASAQDWRASTAAIELTPSADGSFEAVGDAAGAFGQTSLLDAQPFPCDGAWDCNNADAQDWKREGAFAYLPYNGSNFFGCRDAPARNQWGIGLARAPAAAPLGPYTRVPEAGVEFAARHDLCGVSYPYVNVVGGEIFVYFSYYLGHRRGRLGDEYSLAWRSRLVCDPGQTCGGGPR